MKVYEVAGPGTGETLLPRDRPVPKPADGHVVVRVAACGLNLVDLLMMSGRYQKQTDYPFIPGQEVSGTVSDVGAGVTSLKVGDRVAARCSRGAGLAQCVETAADNCVILPDGIDLLAAAVLPVSFGTADHFLHHHGHLSEGETVLVLGAAGAVGTAALQVCREAGAEALALVSGPAKRDLAIANGAADCLQIGTLDMHAEPAELSKRLKSFLGEKRPDIVVDPIGGNMSEAALRNIAVGGRHLVLGFAAGIPRIPMNLALVRRCRIIGDSFRAYCEQEPQAAHARFENLVNRIATGALRAPAPAHVFDFERSGEALQLLADRATVGRVAVRVAHDA